MRYLIGDLTASGAGLTFVAESGGAVDTGPTFYAPQALVDGDRVLLWGWAWEGAQRTVDQVADAGWAGTLTFPRELSLDGDRLVSRPASELVDLRSADLDATAPLHESAFELATDGPLELVLVDAATGSRETAVSTEGPARVLVDGSIVEVFADGPSATSRHYPTADAHWEVSTTGGVRAWRLG